MFSTDYEHMRNKPMKISKINSRKMKPAATKKVTKMATAAGTEKKNLYIREHQRETTPALHNTILQKSDRRCDIDLVILKYY